MRHLLLVLAAATSLAAGLSAQCHADEGDQQYCERVQEPDGHWSAVRGGGQGDADLRVTALMLLAELGDGSTLRSGPMRGSLKRGVRWLRAQQDLKGRFGLRADPEWLLDHAIATYALAEAMRLSTYPTLAADVREAAAALRRQIDSARPVVGVELRLWAEMIVRSARAAEQELLRRQVAEDLRPADLGSSLLERRLSALPAALPGNAREAAAQFLRDVVAGKPAAVAPAAWVEAPLQDPLASFYACAGLYLRGGPEFRRASKRLAGTFVVTERRDGEHRGSWDAVGEFGERNGRFGTTAGALLLLQIYYRYCRLEVVCRE